MCLTIPGKILQIKKNYALLQNSRGVRQINIQALSNIKIGDWLLATVDFAVKRIDYKEAKEIFKLLEGRAAQNLEDKINPQVKEILKTAQKCSLTQSEILTLLNIKDKEKEVLFSEADITRKTCLKDFICLHGIVEFSNYCQNNCLYCGLRCDNKKLRRYRMTQEEILKVADRACNKIGYKMLVLQSGMDFSYSDNDLVKLVKEIKKKCRCFLFLSIGERSLSFYKKAKKAGADGALLRFETSNKKLYQKIHPKNTEKGSYSARFNLIKNLKKLDYYIASGFLVGLPGQTKEDIANDILMMKKLGVQMPSFGPFIPSQNTPYAAKKAGDMDLVYKVIAIIRLLMKGARIPATTAMETLDPKARHRGLTCGANSLMFNLTPKKYAQNYKIYSNKIYSRDKKLEKLALFSSKESWKMIEKEFRKNIIN